MSFNLVLVSNIKYELKKNTLHKIIVSSVFGLLLFFLFSCNQTIIRNESETEISFKGGVLMYKDTPFNGSLIEYHSNKELKSELNYKNGLEDGDFKEYFENGTLSKVGKFELGKKVGLWENFYPNEQLNSKEYFSKGIKHGIWEDFYENGKMKVIKAYVNDTLIFLKAVNENGILVQLSTENLTFYYNNEDGHKTWLHEQKNGKNHGMSISFYPNGNIMSKGNWNEDLEDGEFRFYNENGSLRDIVKFDNGNVVF